MTEKPANARAIVSPDAPVSKIKARARNRQKPARGRKQPAHGATGDALTALQAAAFFDLPAAAALFDKNNALIAANQLYLEAFSLDSNVVLPGKRVDEIIQYTIEVDLFEDFAQVTSAIDGIAQMKPGEVSQNTLVLRDGRKVGQSVRKLANGSWLALYSDITAVIEAEAQAREAENRWSFALESARQGVWDSNLVTGEIFYSHMWRVLRGFEDMSEEEFSARTWRDRLHPDDVDYVSDAIRRQDEGEILEGGIEYRERRRDGHWIWIHSRGRAVSWDKNGKPTRIIGTDTDITETRNAQAALAEAEERWNFALKGTGQGVWDCDVLAKKMYYSPTWREMRGIEPDEEISDDLEIWLDSVHPDDRDRQREIVRKQYSGDIPRHFFEYREQHRDGHYIWIQARGEPVAWDRDGRPTRIIGIDTDISIRKELELQAQDSLRVLNTTLDNFPGGICMYDKNLVLIVANKGYYQINKTDENWFPVGSTLEDILRFHAERGHYGPVDVDACVHERLEEAKLFTASKFQIARDDGATIEYKRTPLEGGGCLMTFEDITERVKAETQKGLMEKELVQAQRLESLGTLASGIAHEINTPIQYVGDNIRFIAQSFRDLLQILQHYRKSMRVPLDASQIAEHAQSLVDMEKELDLAFILEELPLALDQSAQGVKQVATIVKAIKEFSHPGQEDKISFDINAIIETTLIVSKNQWKYVAEVETQLDRSLPQILCLPGELGQTFLNLVVNAAHAIETAKPDRGLIRVSTRRDGNSVIVDVQDNGCGIPDEIKDRIFDPFFTTKDIGKGTGQGLSIAFGAVVKKHGGAIDCVSHPGEGTTFTISLPINCVAAGSVEDAA